MNRTIADVLDLPTPHPIIESRLDEKGSHRIYADNVDITDHLVTAGGDTDGNHQVTIAATITHDSQGRESVHVPDFLRAALARCGWAPPDREEP